MTPIKKYIGDGHLSEDIGETSRIKKSYSRYTLIDGNLFRYEYSRPLLNCVDKGEATQIMAELHKGICGSHVSGKTLMLQVIRVGFSWPTMRNDCVEYVKKSEQCQKHADWAKA